MTFKKISAHRYQVRFDPDSPIVARRKQVGTKHGSRVTDYEFAGTVSREDFVSYPHGKPVNRHFWTARTPGYMMVEGQYPTREQAAAPLLKGEA